VDSSSMTKRIEEDWILDMDMGGVFFCCYVCLPGLSVGWGFVLLSLSILVWLVFLSVLGGISQIFHQFYSMFPSVNGWGGER
jgi:hypothetical protein